MHAWTSGWGKRVCLSPICSPCPDLLWLSGIPAGIPHWLSPLRLLQTFISLSCSEGLKRTGVITGTTADKIGAQSEDRSKPPEHTMLRMQLAAQKKCHQHPVLYQNIWHTFQVGNRVEAEQYKQHIAWVVLVKVIGHPTQLLRKQEAHNNNNRKNVHV